MRLFLNLSVGRKLAASAALAVGLLILLIVLVQGQAAAVAEAQREQGRLEAAQARIEAAADKLREVPMLERDLLLTQDAAGQQPARARMLASFDGGLAGIVAGIEAQCTNLDLAARAGVFVHAQAGDLAARRGERGLLASDVLEQVRACVNPDCT